MSVGYGYLKSMWVMTLKVGDKLDYPNESVAHVRSIVDGMIVMRRWSRVKRRWRYFVESPAAIKIGYTLRRSKR